MSLAESEGEEPQPPQQPQPREDESQELLHIVRQLTQLLAEKSAPPPPQGAIPKPQLETLLPAVHALLKDSTTVVQTRDRHELLTLTNIAEAVQEARFEEARSLIAERLQTLVTAHTHGWAYTRRIAEYRTAAAAGIYAPPQRQNYWCPTVDNPS